jgi:hypothetical protein
MLPGGAVRGVVQAGEYRGWLVPRLLPSSKRIGRALVRCPLFFSANLSAASLFENVASTRPLASPTLTLNLAPSWVTMYVFMAEPSPTTAVAIGAWRYRGIRLCV